MPEATTRVEAGGSPTSPASARLEEPAVSTTASKAPSAQRWAKPSGSSAGLSGSMV